MERNKKKQEHAVRIWGGGAERGRTGENGKKQEEIGRKRKKLEET